MLGRARVRGLSHPHARQSWRLVVTKLFIGSVRTQGGYRPPITVRATSQAEALWLLNVRYPKDGVEAVLPTLWWPPTSDTGRTIGDIREHWY